MYRAEIVERKNRVRIKKSMAVGLSLSIGLAITFFVTVLLFNVTDYGITIASFGGSIFMILSKSSVDKRKIFGAYIVGSSMGYLFSILPFTSISAALAAISSFALMTLLDFQHPPAIGISIALILNKFSLWTDIIVIGCIFFILSMVIILKIFMQSPERIINFIEIEEEKISFKFRPKEVPDYIKVRN